MYSVWTLWILLPAGLRAIDCPVSPYSPEIRFGFGERSCKFEGGADCERCTSHNCDVTVIENCLNKMNHFTPCEGVQHARAAATLPNDESPRVNLSSLERMALDGYRTRNGRITWVLEYIRFGDFDESCFNSLKNATATYDDQGEEYRPGTATDPFIPGRFAKEGYLPNSTNALSAGIYFFPEPPLKVRDRETIISMYPGASCSNLDGSRTVGVITDLPWKVFRGFQPLTIERFILRQVDCANSPSARKLLCEKDDTKTCIPLDSTEALKTLKLLDNIQDGNCSFSITRTLSSAEQNTQQRSLTVSLDTEIDSWRIAHPPFVLKKVNFGHNCPELKAGTEIDLYKVNGDSNTKSPIKIATQIAGNTHGIIKFNVSNDQILYKKTILYLTDRENLCRLTQVEGNPEAVFEISRLNVGHPPTVTPTPSKPSGQE